ncbi:hypothetical protein GGD38_000410 [Chitinophagaceae bacterium OAS944]|nr:hypothetical protein [Chitinophagaceae bacterium OAS944]
MWSKEKVEASGTCAQRLVQCNVDDGIRKGFGLGYKGFRI